MLRRTAVWYLLIVFLVHVLPATGNQKLQYLNGLVVNVTSDCLLIVAIDHEAQIVRLADVVCPVHDEQVMRNIVEFTRSMVLDKKIRIASLGKDPRGVVLARVYVDEHCLNKELLKNGMVQPRLQENAEGHQSISKQ